MNADQDLAEQHRIWEDWARADPLWAILSDPTRKGGKWELSEFFASGEKDVDNVLEETAQRMLTPEHRRCLDFGCGVGRLSQALARTFDRCDGVDISETMIELARKYNRHGEACQYHVNLESNLALFESNTFDFIFSTIVLQHNPPETAEHYISEFCRVLSPGGVAVFDMTASLIVRHLPEQSHRAEISIDSAFARTAGRRTSDDPGIGHQRRRTRLAGRMLAGRWQPLARAGQRRDGRPGRRQNSHA